MDWHNFKVLCVFGVIACVLLLLLGQVWIAAFALPCCAIAGLISVLCGYGRKRSLEKRLVGVPAQIREIVSCYLLQRDTKCKKCEQEKLLEAITAGNYQLQSASLTEKTSVPGQEPDSGASYYLKFDNNENVWVHVTVYDRARIGDTLWILTTSAAEIKVMQTETEYFSMLTH